jgi:hypothetical protein
MIGHAPLPSGSGLSLKFVDQIDNIEESASGPTTDARAGDGNGDVRLASTGSAHQHYIALMCQEVSAQQITHESFVDGCVTEAEVVDILGQRQFSYRDLIAD